MKISLVYAQQGQTKTYRISLARLGTLVCLLSLAICSALWWGTKQYQLLSTQHQAALAQLAELRSTPDLTEIDQKYAQNYERLSLAFADLKAELARLNAVGSSLIEGTELATEFNLSDSPAMGGPLIEASALPEPALELYQQLDKLGFLQSSQKKQFTLLESWHERHHLQQESYLSGWPAYGKGVWLSSPYGNRTDPFTKRKAYHRGVDIAGPEGTPIVAIGAGVVTWAGERFGFGNLVEIAHDNGMVTRYAHAKEITVAEGEVVEKGEQVALMGSTGRSTGPHVHFEVLRNGRQVSPNRYIYRKARS